MANKTTKLAVAILIVMATLLPAWGQNSTPTVLTYTIQGARVGVEQDGSTWTTTLWILNTWGGDWNAITVTSLDADGKPFLSTWTAASGWTTANTARMHGGPFGNSAMRTVLTANLGTAVAQTFNIQLQTTGGFGISAIVKHLDADGKLLAQPVALTDPALLAPIGTQFGMGFDTGTGPDSTITFSNPSAFAVNATIQAYSPEGASSPNNVPFATVQVVIPPQGRMSRLVSELFSNSTEFASFIAPYAAVGGVTQGYLKVTLDQPGALGLVQESINPDGSIVSTVWHAFPATPPAPPQQ